MKELYTENYETLMKEIKDHINRSETKKFSLFADDMILYIENPRDSIRKLLELMN